jgi:hypothetical protein
MMAPIRPGIPSIGSDFKKKTHHTIIANGVKINTSKAALPASGPSDSSKEVRKKLSNNVAHMTTNRVRLKAFTFPS